MASTSDDGIHTNNDDDTEIKNSAFNGGEENEKKEKDSKISSKNTSTATSTTRSNFDVDTGARVVPDLKHNGEDKLQGKSEIEDEMKMMKQESKKEVEEDEINRMMALQQDSDHNENKEENDNEEEQGATENAIDDIINDLFDMDEEEGEEEGELFNGEDNGLIPPIPLQAPLPPLLQHGHREQQNETKWYMIRLHYTKLSLFAAFLLIHYALRTRQQAYLALVYLSTSRLSYILLGNAIVALTVSTFQFLVNFFLNGLRPNEADTISESMRWNVTETCLALTMFRSHVDLSTCGMFLLLVLAKCLHWAAEIRGSQLRMTEETFNFPENENDEETGNNSTNATAGGGRKRVNVLTDILFCPFYLVFSKNHPHIKPTHYKFILLTYILLFLDTLAVGHCALEIGKTGPSVHILFGFEAAILAVGAINTLLLYEIHLIDGIFSVLHWYLGDTTPSSSSDGVDEDSDEQQQQQDADPTTTSHHQKKC